MFPFEVSKSCVTDLASGRAVGLVAVGINGLGVDASGGGGGVSGSSVGGTGVRGAYLHPELYGQPEEAGEGWRQEGAAIAAAGQPR